MFFVVLWLFLTPQNERKKERKKEGPQIAREKGPEDRPGARKKERTDCKLRLPHLSSTAMIKKKDV